MNLKIKTFSFYVSNTAGSNGKNLGAFTSERDKYISDTKCPLANTEDIDKVINSFIGSSEVKKIWDIDIKSETILRHNNGGCDSILRTYTVIYEPMAE